MVVIGSKTLERMLHFHKYIIINRLINQEEIAKWTSYTRFISLRRRCFNTIYKCKVNASK